MRRSKKILLVPIITLLALVFAYLGYLIIPSEKNSVPAQAAWYNYSWQYKKKITIDHTKVDATLTDFPVLINLDSDADLANYAQDDGDDIFFTLSDDTTKLSHEIETFDGSTGELVAWVKVPSLSHTTDTELYLYYGNPTCASQENGTDVWSNGYISVWHFNETSWNGSADEVKDATSNALHGYSSGATVAGSSKIGSGANLIAGSDTQNYKIKVEKAGLPNVSATTFGFWVKKDTIVYPNIGATGFFNTVSPYDRLDLRWLWDSNTLRATLTTNTNESSGNMDYNKATWNDAYHYVQVTWQSGMAPKLYVDGSLVVTGSVINGTIQLGTTVKRFGLGGSYWLGAGGYDGQNFKGYMDEPRLSNTARTPEWISTEYANQNDPATFAVLDTQERWDIVDPVNPTTFKTYNSSAKTTEFTSGGWGNAPAPYFEWSGASDEGGSGVDGYYLYLGTSNTADPEVTSGIIEADNSPHYTTGTNFTLSQPMAEDTTYYFRIKTKDKAQNLSSAETKFSYSFDSQAPDPPEYINVSPAGCSTGTSFDFSWPVASDNGDSGIAGYDYKKGAVGEVNFTDQLSISESSYQDSDNVFYLRSRDNAGNTSVWQTAVYCTIEAPRIIDGPDVEVYPSTLVISWRSSKETTSHVEVYEGNTYLSEFGRNTLTTDHTINVLGLKSDQTYRYRLSWKDSEGNLNYSDWYETRTAPAPKIIDFSVNIISPTSVIISFLTNYLSTANIEYGKDTTYGSTLEFSSLSTSFSKRVDNLEVGTDYTLRIIAKAEDGTEFAIGKDFSTPPLPTISGLKTQIQIDRAKLSAKVFWQTNVETTSSVFYRLQGASYKEISSSEKKLNHEIEINDLSDNSTYQIYVSGIDQFGNIAKSDIQTFSTPLDTRPPEISDIVIETSNVGIGKEDKAQAAISYSTDEPAKCIIEYAEGISGDNYSNKTPSDEAMSNSHLTIITDLTPQTPYHFRIICSDKGNNSTTSSSQTIISGEVTQSVFTLILKTLNSLFGWMGRLNR